VLALRALGKSDGAIAELARTCLDKLRPVDRAGLYDRDSLLITLPELRAGEAAELGALLCAPLGGRVACGVATFPEAGTTPEQLVSAAFQAVQGEKLSPSSVQLVRLAPDALHVRESGDEQVVRRSAPMLELARLIARLAARPISVLIHGETGSGKELVARELHDKSPRSAAPLKVVNCAAIPETLIESVLFGHEKGSFTGADREHKGVFEQAQGGTVFLDEVGELSAEAQAALLRVLDSALLTRVGGTKEIAVDVRVISATHRDLLALTDTGAFRLDLFHRLNGTTLIVPPLRERVDEIEPLAKHFLASTARRWGSAPQQLDSRAIDRLCAYRWPGNVRELRNVIERAVALADGDVITMSELPEHIRAQSVPDAPMESGTHAALRASLHDHEAQLIRDALEKTGGNQRKAAELLQLPLRTFQRRVSQLGLTRDKHG
jgi:DNA-binding NtrC family response regulator